MHNVVTKVNVKLMIVRIICVYVKKEKSVVTTVILRMVDAVMVCGKRQVY